MIENVKSRKATWLAAGAVAVLLMAGGAAVTLAGMHGPGMHPGPHGPMESLPPMMLEALDLTTEQEQAIQQLIEERHAGMSEEKHKEMQEAHHQLMEVIHDPDATDDQVLEAARQVSAFQEEMAVERHKMAVAIFEILTEEQRQKLLEMKEKMQQHHESFPGGMHKMHGRHGFHHEGHGEE